MVINKSQMHVGAGVSFNRELTDRHHCIYSSENPMSQLLYKSHNRLTESDVSLKSKDRINIFSKYFN